MPGLWPWEESIEVGRVDHLSWPISVPAGNIEAGDELILCLGFSVTIGWGGRDDCLSILPLEEGMAKTTSTIAAWFWFNSEYG